MTYYEILYYNREHLGHDAGGAAVGALLEGPEHLL